MNFEFNFFSLSAFLISIVTLIIHIKNRTTNLRSFSITKETHKRASFDLIYVESKVTDNFHFAKLIVFNPSSTSLLLNCVKLYRKEKITNKIYNLLGYYSKWEQTDIKWWPSDNSEFTKEKFLHEEYDNLLVKDSKNIFVKIPGEMDRNYHKFEVITSFGQMTHITTITGSDSSFNLDFKRTNK